MAGLKIPPKAIIEQIKASLGDRYPKGSIIKELIQNADDARASRLSLRFMRGWLDAANPLLRGPGLAVINDGAFSADSAEGLQTFGMSVKATDAGSIGRFGFGQKAVFHLCDAFVFRATEPGAAEAFQAVVNPFYDLPVARDTRDAWDALPPADTARLDALANEVGFAGRRLLIWLPFRRDGLAPAPGVAIVNTRIDPREEFESARDLKRLAAILALARHLDRIELTEDGGRAFSIGRPADQERLLGATECPDGGPPRLFSGLIEASDEAGSTTVATCGLETLLRDPSLARFIHEGAESGLAGVA